MPTSRLFYWDANIFLSYLNNESPKVQTLEAILDGISQNKKEKIVTSVISKIEVAWIAYEGKRIINEEIENRIDDLWNDSSVIELVELTDEIAVISRELKRYSLKKGWNLKTMDAVHLATAQWLGVFEMNTYDEELVKYSEVIGLRIKTPNAEQPKLI